MKFKVGHRVKIIGDASDYSDHLDGMLGTIVEVNKRDCRVKVDDDEYGFLPWLIWNYNMIPVDEHGEALS